MKKPPSICYYFGMSDGVKKASVLLRVFAKALDFIIIAAATEMVPKAGFYAGLSYLLISDGLFEGRSIGKRLMGLRVVSSATGAPCTMKESILRNAPLGAGVLLYKLPLIGWIFIVAVSALEFLILLGSSEGLRLGDELAKTVVIEGQQPKGEQVSE
ncbi:MAG TPA: RDD family protein [Thermodesulfovibrionales bacterium]|nr:RDD family protein [Thermodesulfovibrionales bacterium]